MKTAGPIPAACPCCNEGTLKILKQDYIADLGDGQKLRIPDIEMEACDQCGEQILSLATAKAIDDAIAEHTEQLSPGQLLAIREMFGVDQTQMGEVLGLGGKTYHRWEKGTQYPSRSMGYYLRVLQEFPDAFEWLRARGWHGRNRLTTGEKSPLSDLPRRFPALAANPSRLKTGRAASVNFAGVFFGRA